MRWHDEDPVANSVASTALAALNYSYDNMNINALELVPAIMFPGDNVFWSNINNFYKEHYHIFSIDNTIVVEYMKSLKSKDKNFFNKMLRFIEAYKDLRPIDLSSLNLDITILNGWQKRALCHLFIQSIELRYDYEPATCFEWNINYTLVSMISGPNGYRIFVKEHT